MHSAKRINNSFKTMTLYFISGLGADKRVFKKINLPAEYTIIHIEWITPHTNESIDHYALRLSTCIDQTKPFCIIGLSFGGLIATELAKIVSPQKVILISSISSIQQRPRYFSIFKYVPLHTCIPERFLLSKNSIIYWFMGVKNPDEILMFNQILAETDILFFRWAISCILHWKQKQPMEDVTQIHGNKDKIFPCKYISTHYIVEGGGHLMAYSNAKEVSTILATILSN
jgi:pimeloyl-ACP methyl ester carboxylesterase